jgi:hypothetical protein
VLKVNKMKFVTLILLMIALVIPASASSVVSWTQTDITDNLTLNYTSSFNVVKDDILGITIINMGTSENDTITVNKINVSDTTIATGSREGPWVIGPGSNQTIYFMLNMTTNDAVNLEIKIHYNVSSENKTLSVTARYPGAPEITQWNDKTNSSATTLTVNTSEVIRFNASADQPITTWKWYKDNLIQVNNDSFFITSWNDDGTLKVNATNANGTSNTITWHVTVNAPSGGNAPNITSWGNSKTGNDSLNLTINQSETVRFNFTADQALTSWKWTLNGGDRSSSPDNFTYSFNHDGTYTVGASGSNINGSTRTLVWNVRVLEKEEIRTKKNATIDDWSPQAVDYVYVNGTESVTIEYSITTIEEMTMLNWTVDGTPVTGYVNGNTYYYTHTWNNNSRLGAHTIIFKGSNNDTRVEFRWYVNVYRIGEEEHGSGSIFDIIDDALENHVTDIKIRMFKYKIAKHAGKSEIAALKVNQLHDEIAKRQMTREALRAEFKAGNITHDEYTAALKQVQREAKYNSKLAKEYAKISKEELKDDKSEEDFKKISEVESKKDKKKVEKSKDKEEDENKVKEEASTKGKSNGKNRDNRDNEEDKD